MAVAIKSSSHKSRAAAEPVRAIEQLDKAIVGLSAKIDSSISLLLQMIREFDERGGYLKWGLSSTAEWLSWRCDIGLSAAREKVRCARALKELPRMMSAFAQGAISYSKIRALTRVANVENEAGLMEFALGHSTTVVEERCRQMRNSAEASVLDARRAYDKRSLRIWRDPNRACATISVDLPLEEAELIANALDKAVESSVGVCPDDRPTWLAMQADALVVVAKHYLNGQAAGKGSACTADNYQVVVHVDHSAMKANEGLADLPIETVRRISCDASVVQVIENKEGVPLDVGRKSRTVPAAIKRALWARDKGCAFPGCTHTRYIDAHHIRHWAKGGSTSLENLMLLCTRHHRLVHEGGYTVCKDHNDRLFFKRPDGRAIPRHGYCRSDQVENADVEGKGTSQVCESAPMYRGGTDPSMRGLNHRPACIAVAPVYRNRAGPQEMIEG